MQARLWLRGALREADLAAIDGLVATDRPGQRLALHPALAPVVAALTPQFPGYRLTRVVAFNKTETGNKSGAGNWGVPWHQDRVIATAARHEVAGFGNWSQKAGVWHCEAPVRILQDMLFVRLHLDDCDETSGPMEIALGSHAEGLVPTSLAEATAARYPQEACLAARGDILVLPMLVLHRSQPAQIPITRRTLRLDLAAADLPSPLEWPR